MKKTFRQYLTEGQRLPHWPKTKEELIEAYQKVMTHPDTGEIKLPTYRGKDHQFSFYDITQFNDDLTVSIPESISDEVLIENWMLVDGQLPFPFKEVNVNFEVTVDCKLKSMEGLPKKCFSINFRHNGLDSSVKNFIGGPEMVRDFLSIDSYGITSLEGFPKMENGCAVFLTLPSLTDFSGIPRNVNRLTISSNTFSHEDFKYLPASADKIVFSSCPNLHSLHNLHKYVKNLRILGFFSTEIYYSILSLAMINGLKNVDHAFHDINGDGDSKHWPADGVEDLLDKYVGTHDVFEFQEDLVDLGLTELAKL